MAGTVNSMHGKASIFRSTFDDLIFPMSSNSSPKIETKHQDVDFLLHS